MNSRQIGTIFVKECFKMLQVSPADQIFHCLTVLRQNMKLAGRVYLHIITLVGNTAPLGKKKSLRWQAAGNLYPI